MSPYRRRRWDLWHLDLVKWRGRWWNKWHGQRKRTRTRNPKLAMKRRARR